MCGAIEGSAERFLGTPAHLMREPGDAGPPTPQPLPGEVQRPLRPGADRRLSGERGKAVGNAAARQPGRAGKAFGRRVGGGIAADQEKPPPGELASPRSDPGPAGPASAAKWRTASTRSTSESHAMTPDEASRLSASSTAATRMELAIQSRIVARRESTT